MEVSQIGLWGISESILQLWLIARPAPCRNTEHYRCCKQLNEDGNQEAVHLCTEKVSLNRERFELTCF
jgi:hypothetical protein